MLEYDRIYISGEIYINKTNASKECDICHYWYFLHKIFRHEPYLCNGCHDLMQKAMNFNDVAIVSLEGIDYRIHFWYLSKSNAINIMKNFDLNEKSGPIWFFLLCIKTSETIYYQRNKEVILNRAKDYYKNDKERLRDNARDKYINLSEEQKNKKKEYERNIYHKMYEKKETKTKRISKQFLMKLITAESLNLIKKNAWPYP